MSTIKIFSNTNGTGDWIRVVADHGDASDVLFEGHRVGVHDLVELLYDAGKIGPSTVELTDLTDEQMEEML